MGKGSARDRSRPPPRAPCHRSNGAALHGRGVPANPLLAASRIAGRFPSSGPSVRAGGEMLQLHDSMPEPHKMRFPPVVPAGAHGGPHCAAASEQKTVGDDYISDCGLFCCQFAACAEEEKMYCWKALSATPVTSMPACSCASRMALVVLPPKMPSALSSR